MTPHRRKLNGADELARYGIAAKTILVFALALSLLTRGSARAQTPVISWAEQLSGSANDFTGVMNAAMDQQGNVIFSGWFYTPTLTFGSQTITNSSLQLNVNGGLNAENGFVAKYNHSGNLLWILHVGGENRDAVGACAADSAGNVFIIGWMASTNVWFGINQISAAGPSGAFYAAKLDPQGHLLWVQQVAGDVGGSGLAVDQSGNIRVGGRFSGASVAFGSNLLSNVYYDSETNPYTFGDFVAEYTGDGNLLWAKCVSFSSDDDDPSFAADSFGNSYLSDSFPGVANFGSTTLTNSGGESGATLFLAKYDPSGSLVWVEPVGVSSQGLAPEGLAVGPQGDCYMLGGYAEATIGTNTLPAATVGYDENAFVAKVDSTGRVMWVNPIIINTPSGFLGANLIVDPMDNCWAIGSASGSSLGFGNVTVTNSDASQSESHCFIAKYDPSGNLLWGKTVNSPGVTTFAVGVLDSTQDLFLYGTARGTNALNLDGIVINGPTDGTNYFFAAKIDGPSLSVGFVGTQVVIYWPTNAAGLSLESSADLSSGNWFPVTNAPVAVGDQWSITNEVAGGSRFYRLKNF